MQFIAAICWITLRILSDKIVYGVDNCGKETKACGVLLDRYFRHGASRRWQSYRLHVTNSLTMVIRLGCFCGLLLDCCVR